MPVDTILFVARLLVGGAFLYSGIQHFFQLTPITAFMRGRGVPYPRETLMLGSAFQAICGVLVIAHILLFWATLGLIVFSIVASTIFHNFWDRTGPDRQLQLNAILKNVAAIGGMLALSLT